jgi:hypothetical protein
MPPAGGRPCRSRIAADAASGRCMRFLPSFCLSSSFRLRVMSPPQHFALTSLRNARTASRAVTFAADRQSPASGPRAGVGPNVDCARKALLPVVSSGNKFGRRVTCSYTAGLGSRFNHPAELQSRPGTISDDSKYPGRLSDNCTEGSVDDASQRLFSTIEAPVHHPPRRRSGGLATAGGGAASGAGAPRSAL